MSKHVMLTKEDTEQVADLRLRAVMYRNAGQKYDAWKCDVQALHIINHSTLRSLLSGDFESDEYLVYSEMPDHMPIPGENKGVHLDLLLIAGSPLALAIVDVLKKDAESRAAK